MSNHKVAIIGGGPGGYVAAIRAAQLGLNPLLIEKESALGGTCLHRGCIPTKALLESAGRYKQALEAEAYGVLIEGTPAFSAAKMQERKNTIVKRMAMGIDGLMKRNNVTVIKGQGHVVRPGVVAVNDTEYECDNIVLATGSQVAVPPVFPVDGRRVLTSDHMLNMEKVPESLIVVGSGAVGMEFATICSRLGSKVTVIEMLPRILPLEDEDVSAEMLRICRKKKIAVKVGCAIEHVEVNDNGVTVTGQGLEEGLTAEVLLAAAGRRPYTEGLGLEELGIKMERGRVIVDENMRTSLEGIYAIGDLLPTPQLAHMASAEGVQAVEHIAGLNPRPLNYDLCPGATYCEPEAASVGLTESRAKERGHNVLTGRFPFLALGKAAVIGEADGFIKLVAEAESGKLLGVHILGPHATDLIAEGAAALEAGMTLQDIVHTIHPHPTLSEAMMEAAHAALGMPINFMPPPARPSRTR